MSAFALGLAAMLWLPGYLVLRLSGEPVVGGEAGKRRWSIGGTEKRFAEVAISLLFLLWIGVTLATIGVMLPATLLGALALPALAAAVLFTKREGRLPLPWRGATSSAAMSPAALSDGQPRLIGWVALALAIAGGLLYQPPFEQIVGGQDPVTYMVSGIQLGRTGAWESTDEIVRTIPEQQRTILLGPDLRERLGHWSSRFLGWYLMDPESARVVPQGLPLYPVAIAVGYMVAGVEGAVRVTPILAVAAVLALFFLGSRWLGVAAGAIGALLLLVSPPQVWFSRFATAESVTQLLFVLGLYGLLMQRRGGGWAFGLMAAVAFGLSWQAHIWTVWLVLPLAAILLFDIRRGLLDRTVLLSFWGPLVVLGLQALTLYFTVTTAYLLGAYKVIRQSSWALIPLIPGVVVLLFALWYWGRRSGASGSGGGSQGPEGSEPGAPHDHSAGAVGWPRKVIAAGVVIVAVYGYWVRPAITVVANQWRAESFVRLVVAVTLPVFCFAVVGLAMLFLDRRRGEASFCVLAMTLGIMVPVLYEPNIVRWMLWAVRRYHAFLPLVCLFAAVPIWFAVSGGGAWRAAFGPPRGTGVVEDGSTGGDGGAVVPEGRPGTVTGPRWAVVAGVLVVALLALPLGSRGWTFRGFKQPGESIALVEEMAASFEDNAVLVFEARSGWGALDFAAPLAYWKGFDVVLLWHKETDAAVLIDFVRRQAQRGRPVYFITQGFNYFVSEPRMVPHRRWRFARLHMQQLDGQLPRVVIPSSFPVSSYRLEPSGVNGPLDGMLDVGEWDDVYVGEALPWEYSGDITARWTKQTGFFWLPGLDETATEIVVHADTIHGSEAFDRRLRARLDGIDLGEIPVEQQWTDYVFEVPSDWRPAAGSAPRLDLLIEPLQPDAVNGNGDRRDLGVLVNAILWR